jgi:CheY-like chemotaxis protein
MDQWQPDVLVADIGMPDVDGYEFIHQVRARGPHSGGAVPAVALTAYARMQDRLRVLSEGYQTHVPKPIQPAELVTVVASLAKRLG